MTLAIPAPRTPEPSRPRLVSLVDRLAGVLERRVSRRGFLSRVAVVGSALAVSPVSYTLRPGTAYASVCGPSSSCSSGYTVFCATIRGGLNRCPPNSLVGGWWKADGSGFCGGSARYYIDCHSACSCGCSTSRGGWGFCARSCTSCGSATCGPGDQCDQRKVCTNNFRYGQCMRHVTCTGPVWCRVVTCTAPWRVPQWQCSSASLTDNNTLHHSSPALPGWTALQRHYTSLGGPAGKLGEQTSAERTAADGVGRFQHFDSGDVWSHPEHGTWEYYGAIRERVQALGWERGPLGYPRSGEVRCADGQGAFNSFVGGDVFWHPRHGAHAFFGDIRTTFRAWGWERGKLGYPVTDQVPCADGVGAFTSFVGGDVFWHPDRGAHAFFGDIRAKFRALGWERGRLGYPTSSEIRTADGTGYFNHFQGGDVWWHPQHGARAVLGPLRTAFHAAGWERGKLGYPVADEIRAADRVGVFQHFAGGDVWSHPAHGTRTLYGPLRQRFYDLQWERGRLGYPATDEQNGPGGGLFNHFVGRGTASAPEASVYWSPSLGTGALWGAVREAWLGQHGGPGGRFGYPARDLYMDAAGRERVDFAGGSLTWRADEGVREV